MMARRRARVKADAAPRHVRRHRSKANPAVKAMVLATPSTAGSVIPEDAPKALGCAGFDEAGASFNSS